MGGAGGGKEHQLRGKRESEKKSALRTIWLVVASFFRKENERRGDRRWEKWHDRGRHDGHRIKKVPGGLVGKIVFPR